MLNVVFGKFMRWYRQNRIKFWKFLVGGILVYALIMTFNNNAKLNNSQNNQVEYKTEINNYNSALESKIESEMSIAGGKINSKEDLYEFNNIIDDFVNSCNQGNVANAYNMLSQDCKTEIYTSFEEFRDHYYNKIFNITKSYTIQNYSGDTYRVIYKDSLIETAGNISNPEIIDYITVVEENSFKKISISGYIKKEQISKIKNVDELKINIVERNIYIDYEKIKIQVKNEGNTNAQITNLQSSKDIYALNSVGDFSFVALNELTTSMVNISAGTTKELILKFNNAYKNDSIIEKICFNNILIDEDKIDNIQILEIEI